MVCRARGPRWPRTFRTVPAGHGPIMQPGTGAGDEIAADALPFVQVAPGMRVVDSTGAGAGTVTAVQAPGTGVRPDAVAGVAEHLMSTGYLRVDGAGFLSNDVYVAGNQIGAVTAGEPGEPGVVELRVHREDLHRATG